MTLLYTIKTYNKSLVENIIANLDATILVSYTDESCDTCDSEHSYTSVKIVLQAKKPEDSDYHYIPSEVWDRIVKLDLVTESSDTKEEDEEDEKSHWGSRGLYSSSTIPETRKFKPEIKEWCENLLKYWGVLEKTFELIIDPKEIKVFNEIDAWLPLEDFVEDTMNRVEIMRKMDRILVDNNTKITTKYLEEIKNAKS